MSYRNPKIFMPDPNAFSKGFESTLQYGVELFAKQKKEKEDLAEKAEQAESILLSATDLGGYKDLDKKIYDSFQNNIRGIVDAGEFAKATPARKQEMLEEIRNLKQGFEKLQGVISTPADEIDKRNPDILALKLQLATDPSKIKVIGSGANMSLSWGGGEGEPINEISVSGLTSKRIINIKQFEEPLRDFDSKSLQSASVEMMNGAKLGRYDIAKNVARSTYIANLQSSLSDEQYAYIYTNKIKGDLEKLDEQKAAVLDYKAKEFEIKLNAQDERAKLYKPLPASPSAAQIKTQQGAEAEQARQKKIVDKYNLFLNDPKGSMKGSSFGKKIEIKGDIVKILTGTTKEGEKIYESYDIKNPNDLSALAGQWAESSGVLETKNIPDFKELVEGKRQEKNQYMQSLKLNTPGTQVLDSIRNIDTEDPLNPNI